jgi:hypothetical protein
VAELPEATQVALDLAAAFEGAGIPYAIGGAVAYGFYGPPRATNDVDVDVFVPPEDAERVFDALGSVVEVDRAEARARIQERGDFVARASGMRVDVFLADTVLTRRAGTRVQRKNIGDRMLAVLSAEDLVIFKLMFYRDKDLLDIRYLLPLKPDLDTDYVRTSLVDVVGEDDERVRTWDEMLSARA